MRKSAYGPLRCDTCGFVLDVPEMRILNRAQVADPIHLRCLNPAALRRALVNIGGGRCLFCGQHMPMPDLVDHFNTRHGRVLVNW